MEAVVFAIEVVVEGTLKEGTADLVGEARLTTKSNIEGALITYAKQ